MSGKRPPPSPIRQGGSVRPPPPPVSTAPAVVATAGGGPGLKIGIAIGVSLAVITVLTGGALGIATLLWRGEKETAASAEKQPASADSPRTNQPVNQEGQTSSSPSPQKNFVENGPQEPSKESPKAVPVEPPKKKDPASGAEKTPTKATTPPATNPPSTTVATPEPASPPTAPSATSPTTPPSASAFDDVRLRGNLLPLPEPKITDSIELAKIEVVKPADCDLSVEGANELGQAVKLDRADTGDKRTWTVSLKGNGALNKDRAIAEFTLRDKTLTFQWRTGAASNPFPLHYCLLRIAAGGEKETCRMAKPAPLPPLKVTPGETASIEMSLPLGMAQKMQVLRLEITPIDFPSVQFQANKGLQAGQSSNLKVTGSATGTLPPDLEIDLKFEGTGGKAALKFSSSASWPPDAKGRSVKGKVSVALLEAKKKEVAKRLTPLLTQKKRMETEMTSLEQTEAILNNTVARTIMEQNQRMLEQAVLSEKITRLQTSLNTCIAQHDAATATVQWCDDMLALCKDLESRGRLGIRIYREVGPEVIEIIAADTATAP